MRFGHFDDARREYVITDPRTPMSWINYLGDGEYCGLVSNNAGGYAFHKSPKSGRLLRMRFNSIPMDRPGRYVYLRDQKSGDYWSASWQPVGKPLDQFHTACRHGLGYTVFESRYDQIETRLTLYVPVGSAREVWNLEVTNHGLATRELGVFAYAEWAFWEMMQDLTNFQYILYTCRMGYADSAVDYFIRFAGGEEPRAYLASVGEAESFETDRDAFVGLHRNEGNPVAVEQGRCEGTLAVGGTPCAALQSSLTLECGETARACWVLGVGDPAEAQQMRALYADPGQVEADLEELAAAWGEKLAGFRADTPCEPLNHMLNVWNQAQCHTTFHWSRSASFNEAGGRDGLGFRDSCQDVLGVVHVAAEQVRPRLVELLKAQHAEGCAMHSVQPLTWSQGEHNVQPRGEIYSDDHLWLGLAIPAYIKESDDWGILDQIVPYADQGAATVFEHLLQALEFSWVQRGPHGLPLGLRADWNDCLNLRGDGESAFSTFLFLVALDEVIELGKRTGRPVAELETRRDAIREAVQQHLWDGEWFRRGYIEGGHPLGSKTWGESKVFLNAQTWAVLSGAATPEQAVQAMDAVAQYLATEHGCVKNFPAYRTFDPRVGAITSFPPGLKENAGIFCHANTWAVLAEAKLGRGDLALERYLSFCPAAKNDTADHYTMEPYVFSQFITGKEHPYKFGRARNSWLTGTAAWSFVAAVEGILGIRGEYDGLRVAPALPSEWPGFTATRRFRGATYHIEVSRDLEPGLKVDGRAIAGHVVPLAAPGSVVRVQLGVS